MKKKYVSPSSFICNIELHSIMAGSLDPNNDGNQTVTPDDKEPAPGEFTSRRRSSWDDEDEESSQKLASEWYAVAASFGSAEGESGYSRITSVFLTDDEKRWLRRNYIRSRKHCLRD